MFAFDAKFVDVELVRASLNSLRCVALRCVALRRRLIHFCTSVSSFDLRRS